MGINIVYSKICDWLKDKIERYELLDGVYPKPEINSEYDTRKKIIKREIALLESVKTIIEQECPDCKKQ